MISTWLNSILYRKVSIAPLVTFRFVFGLLMFVSIIRFWSNGWIEAQFVEPLIHFKYFGFHWIPDPSPQGIYLVFTAMAISSLMIAFGAFYRLGSVVFFLLFTYVELIDATYYLNHYYFVSLVSFLMIFLPAHKAHSLDSKWGLVKSQGDIHAWPIRLIQFQLGLVYFMAGIAKLNADWLIEAMPLAIWLPAQSHWPIIGDLFEWKSVAYLFSWGGAIYDLSIPFLLLIPRFRWLAYAAVVGFHLATWSMFQIGMFPFIMIGATLIFFSGGFHQRLHQALGLRAPNKEESLQTKHQAWLKPVLVTFVVIQILFPFRNELYPGNSFWHEQGYRFGWRVMLTEKAGHAQFKVFDNSGASIWVDNRDFLTPVQEKMMSTQPDFMLQYAAFLKKHYQDLGVSAEKVTADVHVTLNGRPSRAFIDNQTNLAAVEDGWAHKNWILPFER